GTRSDEGHDNWAAVRNGTGRATSIIDSTHWTGRGAITRSATLHGSALSEGNRNVLRAWGKTYRCSSPVECSHVFAVVDYFTTTYWRRFNALNGYLPLNSAAVTGDYQIQATGFGFPGMRVYDVTDSLHP